VGGNKTERVDVRIIAATNKNLEHQISINAFREDLYYRLRSINIYIPPLRNRKEDIKLLLDHFVLMFCENNKLSFKGITDDAMTFILNYSWPGNIRQLKNFIESILTLNPDKIIDREDVMRNLNIPKTDNLPATISNFREQDERQLLFRALFELKTDIMDIKQQLAHLVNKYEYINEPDDFVITEDKLQNITYNEFEQELLTYYWNKFNGNISKIAEKLKISNRTLYRKFKAYGLKNGRG
jgi:DNA-binding NtrC family response regulator